MKEFLFKIKIFCSAPKAFARWRRLQANEMDSRENVLSRQELNKRTIVKYAFEQIPFYQTFYREAGFTLEEMNKPNWFEKLPIVTKDLLRERFEEFTPERLKKYRKVSTTGGSTGTPTKTGYDGRLLELIYSWRLLSWYGIHPWDDGAYVWRIPRASRLARIKNALLWWPTKHLKLDASFMSEETMSAFLCDYNRMKPKLLQGYVGAIVQLAQYVSEKGLDVWAPQCVWVTSAPLSSVQRDLLKKVFRAPVCDQYGSCEVRWLAQQCPEGDGLHVNTEHVFIEFVNDENQSVPHGEYGRVLLTNLEDRVFPLIRYENGDRGRWLRTMCACGRSLPCIDAVKGRESESFMLPSGKIVNGEYLTTIFDNDPSLVRGFRVVQMKDLSICVEYLASKESDFEQRLNLIQEKLKHAIKDEVAVVFKEVDAIAHDRGKLRFVVKENI